MNKQTDKGQVAETETTQGDKNLKKKFNTVSRIFSENQEKLLNPLKNRMPQKRMIKKEKTLGC